eukprot:TRINITY_DN8783_c0_g1_i2.p1 TRINITY_DN8783_c0_g1~~TRINITY_DN8783_c0_g1_i2.p1  ORF type:complete len:206 (+),score=67.70 TRINITY_DN8783_c0_g1_i2:91-708(+)
MIRRPPRSTLSSSSAASDVYKRQAPTPPPTASHEEDEHEMTEAELNAALDKDFQTMDTDNDKHINLEEYRVWDSENPNYADDFSILDRNHDGRLSRNELSGHDDEEAVPAAGAQPVADAAKPAAAEHAASDDEDDYYSDDETEDATADQHAAFEGADTDGNGQVEQTEFDEKFPEGTNEKGYSFGVLDADGNGWLDVKEFSKAKA